MEQGTSSFDRALGQIAAAKVQADVMLSLRAVELMTGWARATIYRRVKTDGFPAPVMPGRWHGGSVIAYVASKMAKAAE